VRHPLPAIGLGLCACDDPAEETPCTRAWASSDIGDGSRSLSTFLDGEAGDVHVQLLAPDNEASAPGWPVVVVIHGAWDAAGTPIGPHTNTVAVGSGLVALHLDLPGGGHSDGFDDRRGPAARSAVATAMQFASGATEDQSGCTILDREPGADATRVYLLGVSNGGNLAAATLADRALDLPEVGGLVTWETPTFPQAVNVELGNGPTVYEPGLCELGDAGVQCSFDTSLALVDTPLVCLDLGADSACDRETDVVVQGARDPATGLLALSVPFREALGPEPVDLYDSAEAAAAFWPERDAVALAEALVQAQPELPIIVVASEDDHVLRWSDHPHVVGWVQALQHAGASWVRVNPGADWIDAAGENAPGAPFRLGAAPPRYLAEDEESPLGATLAAAIEELAERQRNASW
jgi:dienelactone hydrolase